ncbi:MAG TPA: hypothetical protein VIM65_16490 [Cyclobacteriaceae bacterium]
MKKYYFRTREFAVSDTGIHLLRGGFNYATITFDQIHKIEIGKGRELNNWFAILIIGLILLIPGIRSSINIISMLLQGGATLASARIVLFLLIPVVGMYFIYASLRTGTILRVHYGRNKKDKFSLRKIVLEKQMDGFEQLMKNKLNVKLEHIKTIRDV